MPTRATTIHLAILLSLIVMPHIVRAGEEFDAAARAKSIAPFINQQTLVVAHADLRRIKLDALIASLAPRAPEWVFRGDESRAGIGDLHAAFLKAGFPEVYLVFGPDDVPLGGPFLILPMTDRSDLAAVLKFQPKSRLRRGGPNPFQRFERLGNVLFIGGDRALERIKHGRPDPRPKLTEAFQAAGDTAAQLLVLPTDNDRRVIEEMLPNLPEEVGGGRSTVLTRGMLWAALGVNLPPGMSLHLVFQSEDVDAARGLADKLAALVRPLVARGKAAGVLRDFDQAVAALTPQAKGDRIIFDLDENGQGVEAFIAAVTPPIEEAQTRVARSIGTNNLKHIGLAMHNWHDAYKTFPAQANFDAAGRPLLSWRVHVLPFLEGVELYNQFHLDEPWDSKHNSKLIKQMPKVFRSPLSKKGGQGYTSYLLPIHEEVVCTGLQGLPIKEIKDGTSNTIMVVEVGDDQAVIWTKPQDLPVDLDDPAKGLGGLFKGGFQAAICDGSAHFISNSIDQKTLRALLTRAGGEAVGSF